MPSRNRIPRVVHISGDFPDSMNASKTPVIRTLIDLTAKNFSHYVYSLNRRTPSPLQFSRLLLSGDVDGAATSEAFSYGQAITYLAPPKGIFHKTMLVRQARWIAKDILDHGCKPDLIVGHKLSIEGIIAERVATLLGTRFAISIQGDSDTKILSMRRDLSRTYARIFHRSSAVFPFAPWALRAVEERLGRRTGATFLLPCPTDIDEPTPPQMGDGTLVTVFHLKNAKRKNLEGIAAASKILAKRNCRVPISVIGGGTQPDRQSCQAMIRDAPEIKLAGPMDRSALRQCLPSASGFIMPSRRESFGLVFIEALFCGLPIIFPKGAAVDGFLDGQPFALGVDPNNPNAIANAMQHLIDHEQELKQALAAWQLSDDAIRFTRAAIGETFSSGLKMSIV